MSRASSLAVIVRKVACLSVMGAAASAPASYAQSQPTYRAAEWAKIVAAAKAEKKVLLYSTGLPAIHDRVKVDFENANPGLVLEVHRLVGFELTSRIEQERASKTDGGDVAIVTDMLWIDKQAQERLLRAPAGPALQEWPSRYLRAGVAPMIGLESHAIVYNVNRVKVPITGYRDLVKPENKLKLGGLSIVAPVVAAFYDWLEKNSGPDFLKNFAASKPGIHGGHPPSTQAVASGEIDATIASNPNTALPLIAQGAPIKMVMPNPSFAFVFVSAALGNSRRPNAGLVFLDYLMSRRGQTTWHAYAQTASPLKGIPGAQDPSQVNAWEPEKWPPEAVKAYTERWNAIVRGQ